MLHALAAGLTTLSMLTMPVVTMPAPVVPPGHITIKVVSANGTGCPVNGPGAGDIVISPDNQAFTVTYSNYIAQAGAGAENADFRKNCQLAVNVNVPQGFTYAIARADYRGWSSLAPGVTASEQVRYYFQGDSYTAYVKHPITPADTDWEFSDEVGVAALVYAPCGAERNLNINTIIQIGSRPSTTGPLSLVGMDSTDGKVSTVYNFAWKTC
jgi:hypothetical protein